MVLKESFWDQQASEIRGLLGYPMLSVKRYGKEYRILRAFFKILKEALQRQERIYIEGLGSFTIRTRKPKMAHRLMAQPGVKGHIGTYREMSRAKKYIFFKPSRDIIKELDAQQKP